MDEFFRGLDGRLRVSGMVADSIMMGIVNSAMENAYTNSCSKEGDLVRLNEKSRFCELATMQLEWCLKFLQEETEDSHIVESSCDREKLLSDLWLTRDRILNRLKETELMIAEKDRELSDMMEIESNLMLALEVKDEDITSLYTALGLEREKRKRNKKSLGKIGGEVKSCVDEQLRKVKAKLEDGQHNLKSIMRRISSRSLDFDRLTSEFDVEGEARSHNNFNDESSTLMFEGLQSLNLEIEFKEMAMDMDILKEKIDSSFKTMAGSVSLFKTMLDEQRWVWNAERETVDIIIRSFMRELQPKFNFDHMFPVEPVSPARISTYHASFVDDIASLHKELGNLAPELDTVKTGDAVSSMRNKRSFSNNDVRVGSTRDNESTGEGNKDSSSMFGQVDTEELCVESPSCRSVAQKIRSHEFFIQKKALEIDSLKGSREKGSSRLGSEGSLNLVKDMITQVSSSVESILNERADIVAYCDNIRWKVAMNQIPLQNSLSGPLFGEEKQNVVQSIGDNPGYSNSMLCCDLIRSELSEEIEQLREEKDDVEMESIILEDTYLLIFAGLKGSLHEEFIDNNINSQMSGTTFKNILSEMIKEWSSDIESYNTEIFFMEETHKYILNEAVKDICCAVNSSAMSSYDNDLPFEDTLFESSQLNIGADAMHELDALPIQSSERGELKLDFSSASLEPNIHLDFDQGEFEESNEQDDAFSSGNGRFGKVFQQLSSSDVTQLKKRLSSKLLDDEDVPHAQVTSAFDSAENSDQARLLQTGCKERDLIQFQLIVMPLIEFSKRIIDFEVMARGKIKTNMERLADLNQHVPPFIEQAISIRSQQALYQKAFMRRCFDLQTAEVEVDLLGDEVDLLYGLVEKINKVLTHYSPILQHYCGIMDVLRLIRKQLHEKETCTTRQALFRLTMWMDRRKESNTSMSKLRQPRVGTQQVNTPKHDRSVD